MPEQHVCDTFTLKLLILSMLSNYKQPDNDVTQMKSPEIG